MVSTQQPGWTAWNGGRAPVADDILVEVRLRYAGAAVKAPAGSLRWSHDLYNAYGAEDIVAYRPVVED